MLRDEAADTAFSLSHPLDGPGEAWMTAGVIRFLKSLREWIIINPGDFERRPSGLMAYLSDFPKCLSDLAA
jgi:hypothetical protein